MWRVIHLERTRIAHYVGRHGLILILFGLIWIVFGLTIIFIPPAMPRFTAAVVPTSFGQVVERPGTGWLWIASGLVSWCSAIFRRYHQPDVVGFNALLLAPLMWVLFYAWSFIAAIVSHGIYGLYRSVVGGIVWSIVLIAITVVAGWPDPDRPDGKHGERS